MNEGKDLPPWPFYDHGGFLPPSPKQMKTTEKQMYISKPVQPLQSNQPKAIPPMNITPNTTLLTLQPVNNPPNNHHIFASEKDQIIETQKKEIAQLKKELKNAKDELRFYIEHPFLLDTNEEE